MCAETAVPTFQTERTNYEATQQTQAGTQANFDGLSPYLPSARLPSTQRSGTADHPGRMRHRTPQNLAATTRKRAFFGKGDFRGQSVFESSMTLSHDVHRLYQNQTLKNKMNCLERIMTNKLRQVKESEHQLKAQTNRTIMSTIQPMGEQFEHTMGVRLGWQGDPMGARRNLEPLAEAGNATFTTQAPTLDFDMLWEQIQQRYGQGGIAAVASRPTSGLEDEESSAEQGFVVSNYRPGPPGRVVAVEAAAQTQAQLSGAPTQKASTGQTTIRSGDPSLRAILGASQSPDQQMSPINHSNSQSRQLSLAAFNQQLHDQEQPMPINYVQGAEFTPAGQGSYEQNMGMCMTHSIQRSDAGDIYNHNEIPTRGGRSQPCAVNTQVVPAIVMPSHHPQRDPGHGDVEPSTEQTLEAGTFENLKSDQNIHGEAQALWRQNSQIQDTCSPPQSARSKVSNGRSILHGRKFGQQAGPAQKHRVQYQQQRGMPNEPTIIDVQVPAQDDGIDGQPGDNGQQKQRIYSRLLGESKCSKLSGSALAKEAEVGSTAANAKAAANDVKGKGKKKEKAGWQKVEPPRLQNRGTQRCNTDDRSQGGRGDSASSHDGTSRQEPSSNSHTHNSRAQGYWSPPSPIRPLQREGLAAKRIAQGVSLDKPRDRADLRIYILQTSQEAAGMTGDHSADAFPMDRFYAYASAQKAAAMEESSNQKATQGNQPLAFNQVRIQDMKLDGLDGGAVYPENRRTFAINASTRPSKHAYKLRTNSRDSSPHGMMEPLFSPVISGGTRKTNEHKQQFLHLKHKKNGQQVARIVAAIPDKAMVDAKLRPADDLMCRTMTLSADWKVATPIAFNTHIKRGKASILKTRQPRQTNKQSEGSRMNSLYNSPTGTRDSCAASKVEKLIRLEDNGSSLKHRSIETKQRSMAEPAAAELHHQSRKGQLMVNQNTQHDELLVKGVEIEQRLRDLKIKNQDKSSPRNITAYNHNYAKSIEQMNSEYDKIQRLNLDIKNMLTAPPGDLVELEKVAQLAKLESSPERSQESETSSQFGEVQEHAAIKSTARGHAAPATPPKSKTKRRYVGRAAAAYVKCLQEVVSVVVHDLQAASKPYAPPVEVNTKFLDRVARARSRERSRRNRTADSPALSTEDPQPGFPITLTSQTPAWRTDQRAPIDQQQHVGDNQQLLQQQNERQVNFKKQNQLKKLLEEMSRQRAKDQSYAISNRKPALPEELPDDGSPRDENDETLLQIQPKKIAKGITILNGFARQQRKRDFANQYQIFSPKLRQQHGLEKLEPAGRAKAAVGKNKECSQRLQEMKEQSRLVNRLKVEQQKRQRDEAQRAQLSRHMRYHLELGSNSLTLPPCPEDSGLQIDLGSKADLSKSRSSAPGFSPARAPSPGPFLNAEGRLLGSPRRPRSSSSHVVEDEPAPTKAGDKSEPKLVD